MATTNLSTSIHSVFEALDSAGVEMIGTFAGFSGLGFKLASILAALSFAWILIEMMMGEDLGKSIASMVKTLMTYMLVVSLLIGWSKASDNYLTKYISVSGFFIGISHQLSKEVVNHASGSGGDYSTSAVIDRYMKAFDNMSAVPGARINLAFNDNMDKISKSTGWSFFSSIGEGVGDALLGFFTYFAALATVSIGQVFILISLGVYLFCISYGSVIMYVALTMGPILVPFLLFEKMKFLFDGWFKLIISASLYKVIAVIISILMTGSLDKIIYYSATPESLNESILIITLAILFFALISSVMMTKADNIASALSSGVAMETDKFVGWVNRAGATAGKNWPKPKPPK